MKTVYEHLLDLPSPYNELALKNAMTDNLDILVIEQTSALQIAFLWHNTPEQEFFWELVDDCFCKK